MRQEELLRKMRQIGSPYPAAHGAHPSNLARLPERSKGAGCSPADDVHGGSNPSARTDWRTQLAAILREELQRDPGLLGRLEVILAQSLVSTPADSIRPEHLWGTPVVKLDNPADVVEFTIGRSWGLDPTTGEWRAFTDEEQARGWMTPPTGFVTVTAVDWEAGTFSVRGER